MSFAYDCFLPEGQTWRDLFDMVRAPCTPSVLSWTGGLAAGRNATPWGWQSHRRRAERQHASPVQASPACISKRPGPRATPPAQVIINARKPDFFISSMPLYEVGV